MTYSRRRHTVAAAVSATVACALFASCSSTATHNSPAAAGIPSVIRSSPPAVPPGALESVTGGSRTAVSGTATACALITERDVTSVLGADPGAGNGAVRATGSTCGYVGTLLSVNLTLKPAGGKHAFDSDKTLAPGSGDTVVEVPGLGDGAFGIFHAPLATVDFYKGESFVSILVSSTRGDTSTLPKDQALALAKIAAARV